MSISGFRINSFLARASCTFFYEFFKMLSDTREAA